MKLPLKVRQINQLKMEQMKLNEELNQRNDDGKTEPFRIIIDGRSIVVKQDR